MFLLFVVFFIIFKVFLFKLIRVKNRDKTKNKKIKNKDLAKKFQNKAENTNKTEKVKNLKSYLINLKKIHY